MLLGGSRFPLACQHLETAAYEWTSFSWEDGLIDVSQSSCNIRIRELVPIFLHKLCSLLLLVLLSLDFLPEDDND